MRTLGGELKKCLGGYGYLRGFLNLGLKLKGNHKAVAPALMRTNVTSPVTCKSMGLLY